MLVLSLSLALILSDKKNAVQELKITQMPISEMISQDRWVYQYMSVILARANAVVQQIQICHAGNIGNYAI